VLLLSFSASLWRWLLWLWLWWRWLGRVFGSCGHCRVALGNRLEVSGNCIVVHECVLLAGGGVGLFHMW
jgi:hypothetical protein